jgi:hypothetical protein
MTGAHRVLVGQPKRKRTFGRLTVDGKIILKWIGKKWDEGHGLN